MKIVPSSAIAMSVGLLNGCPENFGAGRPGVPIVISSSPSVVHFVIVCAPSSAQYRYPSCPARIACVASVNAPAPKVRRKFPSLSRAITGFSGFFVSIQTVPSGATDTPGVSCSVIPSGSRSHSSRASYGRVGTAVALVIVVSPRFAPEF